MTTDSRPLVTIIAPAFNEEAILTKHLQVVADYMRQLETDYRWELLIINDGSSDRTGELADEFVATCAEARAIHHPTNLGVGRGMTTGFGESKGDYIVVLDIDLSYDVPHIKVLLERLQETSSKMIIASPYAPGGRVSNVPKKREVLSRAGNKFLRFFAPGAPSTITPIVTAYDGPFARSLNLRATGLEVMPEIIYKAMVLRAPIEEVAAHLNWGPQLAVGKERQSSMRILSHSLATVLAGFIFRPFMFLVLPGVALLLFAAYCDFWILVHFFQAYSDIVDTDVKWATSEAVAMAYQRSEHTFVVGLFATVLGISLVGLGTLALQSKRYFEETFSFQTRLLREINEIGKRTAVNR